MWGVGNALWMAMMIGAGLSAALSVTRFNRYSVVNDVLEGRLAPTATRVSRADDLVDGFGGALGFVGLVIFVLLIIWTYRNVANMRDVGEPARGSVGLSIGGFFIPLANAFIPYRFFSDIAAWLGNRGHSRSRYALLPLWWWPYIIGVAVAYAFGSTDYLSNPTIEDLRSADLWGGIGMGVVAVALLLGSVTIRNMTADASS